MHGSVAAEVTSLVTRQQVHENMYIATRVPEGPPRPAPGLIGMASSPQLLVSKAMPKLRPKPPSSIPSAVEEVRRPDLTTIAIHPFEADDTEDHIAEI